MLVVSGALLAPTVVGQRTAADVLGLGDGQLTGVGAIRTTSFTALADTRLFVLRRELSEVLDVQPDLAKRLLDGVLHQLSRHVREKAVLQLPRVEDRVLVALRQLASRFGQQTEGGIRLDLALTHEMLGGLCAARRPTVTMAIIELEARGHIERRDRSYVLLAPRHPTEAGPGRRHDHARAVAS